MTTALENKTIVITGAASAITGAILVVDHGDSLRLAAPETLRFDSQ